MHVAVRRRQRAESGGREEERAGVVFGLRVEPAVHHLLEHAQVVQLSLRGCTSGSVGRRVHSCSLSGGAIVARLADDPLRDMGGSNAGVDAAEMQSGVE